jgi:ABC-type transporter Mla subunit MlaD
MEELSISNRDLSVQIESLENMITVTEDFYGFISDELPQIESDIEDTIEETEMLIDYFTDTQEEISSQEEGFQIREVMENLESDIKGVYNSLSARENIADVLQNFISDNRDGEAQFEKILGLIDDLNRVLHKLDNLSMNAVIFSVKSDQEGAAFRVISDEINDLSNKIETKYNGIEEQIIDLEDWNNGFADDLRELIETEEQIAEEYRIEVEEIFSDILESLQTISNILKNFMGHIQEAVEPVYEIIVLLQNQDIIRQNLENLIEIFNTLQAELNDFITADGAARLDKLVFITDTSQLAQKLMINILDQLDQSLFEIKSKFEQMKGDLDEIDEEGDQLISFFAGGDADKQAGSVDLIYQQLVEFVPQLIDQLEQLDTKYDQLAVGNNTFYDNMEGLKDGFVEIDQIADRLKKIEVLAKIEYTRLEEGDKSFIQNIEEAIQTFIKSSQKNKQMYLDLKEDLISDYEKFLRLSENNQIEIQESVEVIDNSEEKLLMTKKMIKDAITSLHHSSKELINEIVTVNQGMDQVEKLVNKGEHVIDVLADLEEESRSLKEEYLSNYEQDEWTESNQRLQKLEEQFTSYLERKTAQEEVSDLSDIDAGSEGGELTMF